MSDARAHRFMKGIADFTKHAIDGICMTDYDENNMRFVEVSVVGPVGSPYVGGYFGFRIKLPPDFPFVAPKVHMSAPIFHPNICSTGKVCVSVRSAWSPATTLLEVAEAIRGLLADPNPDSPLNTEAAWMLDTNKPMYEATVKMWTSVLAGGPERPEEYNNKIMQVMEVLRFSKEQALRELTTWTWEIANVVGRILH